MVFKDNDNQIVLISQLRQKEDCKNVIIQLIRVCNGKKMLIFN